MWVGSSQHETLFWQTARLTSVLQSQLDELKSKGWNKNVSVASVQCSMLIDSVVPLAGSKHCEEGPGGPRSKQVHVEVPHGSKHYNTKHV